MTDFLTTLAPLATNINDTMKRLIAEDEESVKRISDYSFSGGGKRLRPLIFCLSLKALGVDLTAEHLETASSFEFLHMATLLHDDIVDAAEVRRGRLAAHLAFGAPETVLVGDYLLSKAASLGAKTGNMECVKILSKVVGILSLGELIQLGSRHRGDLSETEYFGIIYRKTAVLMESAAQTAAMLTGAAPEFSEALAGYGRKLGLAFQIMDDVLDYQGDAEVFGKPVGHDLDEGKITLPLIMARDNLKGEKQKRLHDLAELENITSQDYDEVMALVSLGGGVEAAKQKARHFADEAVQKLEALPPSAARDQLKSMAYYAVERVH